MHALSLFVVAVISVFAISYTTLCALGFAPWFTLTATFGELVFPEAGFYLQLVITALVGSLLFFIPASGRTLALEQSHRNFQIKMEDVAHAYHLVHTADRSGLFTLSSEFDAVRERLSYLRDHPDLERLEPGVMEVAAQMSQQARHLADVYNDDKVARAKDFLRQRQQDAELQQERIVEALHSCTEIRKWAQQVELEESIVASQLAQLDEQLQSALPALGYSLEHEPDEIVEDMSDDDLEDVDIASEMSGPIMPDGNVVNLPKKPAAE
ncbi:DNA repair protein [Yoonia sp. 208BN28-4]|uniref:DNA repair protein n=1 Tax=Yoonia sp. 208BN28-4 TaxID=3126505 RepID=UPI0030B17912